MEIKVVHKSIKKNIFYRGIKRFFDVFLALLALILFSPVFLGTMIAIAVEDGRPFFYNQKRVGKGKREFRMYKFRSMRKDADKIHEQMKKEYGQGDVSFKLEDSVDPRITRIGRFIRKTNIDELPQLVNIIKGDMSIVGPRPLPTYEFAEEQEKFGGEYDGRYDVPQGLTCYWQTTFSNRGRISFSERMQMDVDYAKESNLWLDIKLIIKTAVGCVFGKAGF